MGLELFYFLTKKSLIRSSAVLTTLSLNVPKSGSFCYLPDCADSSRVDEEGCDEQSALVGHGDVSATDASFDQNVWFLSMKLTCT